MGVETGAELVEIVTPEGPVERHGPLVVARLERGESFADLVEGGEVVGFDDFALHDRKVDLALVQPGGVDREMDQMQRRPRCFESPDRCLPAVAGTLSTIQNTRFAEAYGSEVITCSTSPNGTIPVEGSQRPITCAR